MIKVFIDGKEGTTGLQIASRISRRKDVTLLQLPEAQRKESAARRAMLHEADIAFLCLPDAAAREAVQLSAGSHVRIVDASTAHRVAPGFAYGLPELSQGHRAAIAEGARVATPGCHASGYILLVAPLVESGLLSPHALLSCTSITGYSGGGKSMIAEYTKGGQAQYAAPQHYGMAQQHKHLPEMQRYAGLHAPPVFNPVVADFYAGMLVSVPLHAGMLEGPCTPGDIVKVYAEKYAGQPLIRVQPCEEMPAFLPADALAGKDSIELWAAGNAERMVLYARYDNLGKGASGAAIQCMNIMLGLPDAEGLNC